MSGNPRSKDTRMTPTVTLPTRCKPSKVCSTDKTRPVLLHAYVRHTERGPELHATNSFMAVRVPINGDKDTATEGFVSPKALKAIEGEKDRAFSADNGRVEVDGGRVSFARDELGTFPDLDKLWPREEPKRPLTIGLNAKLLYELAQGLGDDSVRLELDLELVNDGTYLKPYRVTPLNRSTGADGLLMPVRVNF